MPVLQLLRVKRRRTADSNREVARENTKNWPFSKSQQHFFFQIGLPAALQRDSDESG
jgi:hypothetical protein